MKALVTTAMASFSGGWVGDAWLLLLLTGSLPPQVGMIQSYVMYDGKQDVLTVVCPDTWPPVCL